MEGGQAVLCEDILGSGSAADQGRQGEGGLSCVGRADSLSTPPAPHAAELKLRQGTCKGVGGGALAGPPEGSPWVCSDLEKETSRA